MFDTRITYSNRDSDERENQLGKAIEFVWHHTCNTIVGYKQIFKENETTLYFYYAIPQSDKDVTTFSIPYESHHLFYFITGLQRQYFKNKNPPEKYTDNDKGFELYTDTSSSQFVAFAITLGWYNN